LEGHWGHWLGGGCRQWVQYHKALQPAPIQVCWDTESHTLQCMALNMCLTVCIVCQHNLWCVLRR
jgi:hypothetical protein